MKFCITNLHYHNNSVLDVKIDNVKITPVDSPIAAKSLTTSVAVKELTLGQELDLSDVEILLTRNNNVTRPLASGEYVLDLSQVNKDVEGQYPVTVKAVDEFGKEVSTTIMVKYAHEHIEEVDAPVAPTCTKTGLTEGKHCSVCNEVLVAQQEVPATGHNYSELKHDSEGHWTECSCGDATVTTALPQVGLLAFTVKTSLA